MKKNLILILGLLLIYNLSKGQDKIIRTNGKSYECKIASIDSLSIHFAINSNNREVNTRLNLLDVSSYEWNGKFTFLRDVDSSIVISQSNNPNINPKVVRENVYSTDDKRSSTNAINIGAVGLQTVAISINYEHLFNSKHGLVIGLPVLNTNKGKETGFSVSYRNHFKNTMNSGYWGFFANYSKIESKVEATGYDLDEYKFTNSNFYIGPNIGRRWISTAGLNLGIRIGYGFSLDRKFEWIDTPEDEDMRDMTESMLKVISGFDAELSVGYCF